MSASKYNGFTLMELLIVVTIISILAAIALPSYQAHMTKTRRAEGQAKLMEVINTQERYYTLNNSYSTNLATIGYTTPVSSENDFYTITAAACGAGIGSCVQLTATPGTAQAADGNLTLDSTGAKTPLSKW